MDIQDFFIQFGIFGGLFIIGAVMLIRGDLVPRKTHEETKQDRDYWRGIAQRLAGGVENISDSVDVIKNYGKTTNHLIESLPISQISLDEPANNEEEENV